MAEDHTPARIAHLGFIQDVITRMASTSAAMKRYAIVVAAAAIAFAGATKAIAVPIAGVLLVAVFWYLDGRYLQQEKWFRHLYDDVRAESPNTRPDFRINPSKAIRDSHTIRDGMLESWSTRPLYLCLALFLLLAAVALR